MVSVPPAKMDGPENGAIPLKPGRQTHAVLARAGNPKTVQRSGLPLTGHRPSGLIQEYVRNQVGKVLLIQLHLRLTYNRFTRFL